MTHIFDSVIFYSLNQSIIQLLNLILGGFAGFLTGKLMRSVGYAIIADGLLGLAGGQFAGWLLGLFGVFVPDWNYSVISISGAVFLVTFIRFVLNES